MKPEPPVTNIGPEKRFRDGSTRIATIDVSGNVDGHDEMVIAMLFALLEFIIPIFGREQLVLWHPVLEAFDGL